VILHHNSLIAAIIGLVLCLPWSAPSKAQALDDILTAGVMPADAHSAPGEISMGYGITSALRVAAAQTLMNDREFGFCFAKSDAKTDVKLGPSLQAQSQFSGGQMGISLHCDNPNKLPTVAQMHTHPSFSIGIPSTSDFSGIDPAELAFIVAKPVDGETTAILMTRAARDQNLFSNPKDVASAAAVLRVMVLEFMQGAEPQSATRSVNFAHLYLSTLCGKLELACYYRPTWAQKFSKVDGVDGFINTKYDAAARRRGFVRVQLLLDWLNGKTFELPEAGKPLAVDSMKEAMSWLDLLQRQWQGAVMYTSPHVIMNVQFPSTSSDNFVGLAIPLDGNTGKIEQKTGLAMRTFSATADAADPNAAISGCIRLGENVTINGGRYDDALFGDIASGDFQHHCFSLKAGSALQLSARETVADGYMTTVLNGGEGSVIKTALADFCPPADARQKIMFCNKKPSFTVP
jgi:hypothetical protein